MGTPGENKSTLSEYGVESSVLRHSIFSNFFMIVNRCSMVLAGKKFKLGPLNSL